MLAVLIVASTEVFSGCSGSIVPPAVTSLKWPRTVIIPRCLAANSTWVCIGSNFQVPTETSCLADCSLLMALPTDWRLHLFQRTPSGGSTGTLRPVSDPLIPGHDYGSGAEELWALVVASFAGWEQRVNEAAAAAGLSPVSAWALVQLNPEAPVSQKDPAARIKCNPSTVVDPAARLEAAGPAT